MACSKIVKSHKVPSPIGEILVKFCQVGIHEISLNPKISDENFIPLKSATPMIEINSAKGTVTDDPGDLCVKWLFQYFEDPSKINDVEIPKICPLDNHGFRPKVWEKLLNSVKVGETTTYQELACLLNNPGAARAVGSAMKNNPVCILVPCHRVVRKNGLGLYSGGTRQKIKEWLLLHEGVDLTELGN